MRKAKLLLLCCILLVGCASFKEAASQVTPEQQQQMTQQINSVAGPFIPEPYQIPVTAFAGWLACVGYNWFKKKTEDKA